MQNGRANLALDVVAQQGELLRTIQFLNISALGKDGWNAINKSTTSSQCCLRIKLGGFQAPGRKHIDEYIYIIVFQDRGYIYRWFCRLTYEARQVLRIAIQSWATKNARRAIHMNAGNANEVVRALVDA